jgi:hypothetical protein
VILVPWGRFLGDYSPLGSVAIARPLAARRVPGRGVRDLTKRSARQERDLARISPPNRTAVLTSQRSTSLARRSRHTQFE